MTVRNIKTSDLLTNNGTGTTRALTYLLVWGANLLLIGGAVLISTLPSLASRPFIFGMFLLGHLLLMAHSLRHRDTAFLTLNVSMAVLDIYAIAIRL